MKVKYFSGPSGVYYQPKRDALYVIKKTGARIYDYKRNKYVGIMYSFEDGEHLKDEVAITGADDDIYLGDL